MNNVIINHQRMFRVISIFLLLEVTGICLGETGAVFDWEKLKAETVEAVNASNFSNELLSIHYQRTIEANWSDTSMPDDTKDKWDGELRVANESLYLMEHQKSAFPEASNTGNVIPRVPLRKGMSWAEGKYRSLTVFEEVTDLNTQPQFASEAEIRSSETHLLQFAKLDC